MESKENKLLFCDESAFKSIFSANLKKAIDDSGLSLLEIVEGTDLDTGTVSKWQTGKSTPGKLYKVYQVASRLNLSIDKLCGFSTWREFEDGKREYAINYGITKTPVVVENYGDIITFFEKLGVKPSADSESGTISITIRDKTLADYYNKRLQLEKMVVNKAMDRVMADSLKEDARTVLLSKPIEQNADDLGENTFLNYWGMEERKKTLEMQKQYIEERSKQLEDNENE